MTSSETTSVDTKARGARQLATASEAVRVECAEAFAAEYADGAIPANRRRSAEAILEMFAEDAAEAVRAAIARHLVSCPQLPKSLARAIADDIDAIAVPMIRGSEAFDDADLIAIVRSGVVSRQVAVATRRTVSQPVSGALVETGDSRVVSALLANDGARIAEPDLAAILDTHGGDPSIGILLHGRESLPLTILDRLLEIAGTAFHDILEDAMDLPGPIVRRVCTLAREQLVVVHVRGRQGIREVEDLAVRLDGQQRLTATLVLRALCTGDVQFFAICLAAKADANFSAVRRLVACGDVDGLRTVWRDTEWPSSLFRAVSAVLKLHDAAKAEPQALAPDAFAERAVDRLVREYPELSPGNLDVMLAEICWRLS